MEIKKGMFLFCIVFICIMLSFVNLANAEGIGISTKKNDADTFNFKITLYDDNKNKIEGQLSYFIQDFHAEIVQEGSVNSGDDINFKLPKNPYQGPWKITARYKDIEANELFNVGDVKRGDIKLEGDNLIIENTGNVAYDKKILIIIGDQDQPADILLNVGQTKRIRLTAPTGEYTVKVDDGEKQVIETGVSLTGNVIGVERVIEGGFWSKYPMVALFLLSLFLVFVIVSVLKIHDRLADKPRKVKKRRK